MCSFIIRTVVFLVDRAILALVSFVEITRDILVKLSIVVVVSLAVIY